jgi:mRNA degradation ribonuclease J1/J2
VNTRDGSVESRGLFFSEELSASHAALSEHIKKFIKDKKPGDNEKNFRDFLEKELAKMILKVWEREPVVICV